MIKIYHNPRCKKSRAGLAYLQAKSTNVEIVLYLKEPLSEVELKDLFNKTNLKPNQLIRKQEDYYKNTIKGKEFTDDELIAEMAKEPKLIVRPIVEANQKAVWADPPENIDQIL